MFMKTENIYNERKLRQEIQASLGYHLKGLTPDNRVAEVISYLEDIDKLTLSVENKTVFLPVSEFRPLLFPYNSMIDEQKLELYDILGDEMFRFNNSHGFYFNEDTAYIDCLLDYKTISSLLVFFRRNHIDFLEMLKDGTAADASDMDVYNQNKTNEYIIQWTIDEAGKPINGLYPVIYNSYKEASDTALSLCRAKRQFLIRKLK